MKNLDWITAITSVLGIIFIIYGWTQSWSFGAHTSEFEEVLLKRTVRTYVFIMGGLILLTIGVSLQVVKKHLRNLESKYYEIK